MTTIASEIDRFNRLGATWWNHSGPMRPLQVISGLRPDYLRQLMTRQFNRATASNLEGLRILDVGCGAGLLSEPLARKGAQVTGIDAAARNVAEARLHAEKPAHGDRLPGRRSRVDIVRPRFALPQR